jgi:hypothetical protein
MRQPVCHLRSEAEYFHQLDFELLETFRTRAGSEERRMRLAEASRINEPAILAALEKLGYDQTTVTLLFVVPLVQVAWADGSVSQSERDHIIAIASLRGVNENSPAYERLMAWLDRQPPDEFFQGTLNAIEAVLSSLPPIERKACKQALLLCCRDTAAGPCRLFGRMSRVCAAKRKVIEEISKRLESTRPATA